MGLELNKLREASESKVQAKAVAAEREQEKADAELTNVKLDYIKLRIEYDDMFTKADNAIHYLVKEPVSLERSMKWVHLVERMLVETTGLGFFHDVRRLKNVVLADSIEAEGGGTTDHVLASALSRTFRPVGDNNASSTTLPARKTASAATQTIEQKPDGVAMSSQSVGSLLTGGILGLFGQSECTTGALTTESQGQAGSLQNLSSVSRSMASGAQPQVHEHGEAEAEV